MAKEIFSKNPQAFNVALAQELKKIKQFQPPEWSFYVKTGVSKQRVPEEEDFWFTRAASILRQLYIKGVVGVENLRTRYGGRKNRGVKPAKFKKASGKLIRVMLQQAEQAGLVEKVTGSQFGRRLTKQGRELLDSIDVEETKETEIKDLLAKKREIVQQEGDEELEESSEEDQDGEKA